jgi:predicted ribosomally synthesized peptide with nif11-like leader
MSKSQLNAFVAKMESDPSLKALVASAGSPEAVVAIASDNGNSFSAATWNRHLRG